MKKFDKNQYKKEYYIKNKKRLLKKFKDYYLLNKKEILEKTKIYRENNKEKIKKQRIKNIEKNKKYNKIYRENNKEKISNIFKRWYLENKSYKLNQNKKWIENNIEKRRKYYSYSQKIRRINNPKIRVDQNIGNSIKSSLKNKKYGWKWENYVGFSLGELIKHLEEKFDKNMSWKNYGSYWHIDHIKPKSLFYYESYQDLEFKKCWALSNLQPLEAKENIRKGNKYYG